MRYALLLVFAAVLSFGVNQTVEAQVSATCDGTREYIEVLPSTAGWDSAFTYVTGTDATGAYLETTNTAKRLRFIGGTTNWANINKIYIQTNITYVSGTIHYGHIRLGSGVAFTFLGTATSETFQDTTANAFLVYRDTSQVAYRLYRIRFYCSNWINPAWTATPLPTATWTPVVLVQTQIATQIQVVTATATTDPLYTPTPSWTPVIIYQPVTATPTTDPMYTATPSWTPVIIYQPVTATPTDDPMYTPTPSWTPIVQVVTATPTDITPLPPTETFTPVYQIVTATPSNTPDWTATATLPPDTTPTQTPYIVTATLNIGTPVASRTPMAANQVVSYQAEMANTVNQTNTYVNALAWVITFVVSMLAVRLIVRLVKWLIS